MVTQKKLTFSHLTRGNFSLYRFLLGICLMKLFTQYHIDGVERKQQKGIDFYDLYGRRNC